MTRNGQGKPIGAPTPVLIGLGANLPYDGQSPRQTLEAAIARLRVLGIVPVQVSRWYRTRPVPASDQPDFINGVMLAHGMHDPHRILRILHSVEAEFGRRREVRFAARTLDLDLLACGQQVVAGGDDGLILPHPRLHERAFVLVPMRDVAPEWRHPVLGLDVGAMLARLPAGGGEGEGGEAERRRGGEAERRRGG